jgi:hypothetical protein
MKFQAAAMSRSNIPENERIDFSLYVDEFQNFSTDSFATIMSEARKYHLNLIVANQFTTQLTPEIRDAVFGNMGTIISFRVGQNDVESLGKYFQPIFDVDDLLRVPNYNTIVRTLIGGVPTQPFSMATLPGLGTPNSRLAEALKQLSAAKYGKPKSVVEKDINERMLTKEDTKTGAPSTSEGASSKPSPFSQTNSSWPTANRYNYASPLNGAGGNGMKPSVPTAPKKGASFLDDWLNKRRNGVTSPSMATYSNPTAMSPSLSTPVFGAPEVPPSAKPVVPPAAPPSPIPQSQQNSQETKNISSDVIEQKEVDKIAAELKHQLDNPMKGTPKKADQPAVKEYKKEHTANLQEGQEDTIWIDKEGVMHQSSKAKTPTVS